MDGLRLGPYIPGFLTYTSTGAQNRATGQSSEGPKLLSHSLCQWLSMICRRSAIWLLLLPGWSIFRLAQLSYSPAYHSLAEGKRSLQNAYPGKSSEQAETLSRMAY